MLTTKDQIIIEKNRELKPSQDYYFLREKGMEFIQELSGKLWTDHNSHDPGVTILESICFALTDLGYRTDFDMADLIRNPDGKPAPNNGLFPAHEILTTCPVTIMDYRKLLLKLKDVRNAWLIPKSNFSELPLYVDCGKGDLTYETLHCPILVGPLTGKTVIFDIKDWENIVFNPNSNFVIQQVDNILLKKSKQNEVRLGLDLHYKLWTKTITVRLEEILLRTTDGSPITQAQAVDLLSDLSHEGLLWKFFEKMRAIALEDGYLPVKLNGLYDVLLELEVDSDLGALTERALTYRIPFGDLKGVVIQFDFEESFDFNLPLGAFTLTNFTKDFKKINWTFDIQPVVGGTSRSIEGAKLRIINSKPRSNQNPIAITATKLRQALRNFTLPGGSIEKGVLRKYWIKQKRRQEIIERVCCVLHAHRNLCEDFHNIKTVPAEKVAICVDVETKNEADLEVLYAKIILAIEHYLNPPIKYYTLSELLDEGYSSDEIFDGPFINTGFQCDGQDAFVKAGFVKSDDIENSKLRKVIYSSDLINILVDFEEVIAVKNLQLRKYDKDGNTDLKPAQWCLEITEGHQPIFGIDSSKVLFFKNEIPYTAKVTEAQDHLNFLRQAEKKAAYVEPNQTLPFPEGTYRNLHEYFPLQNDLPQNYGTGESRLPLNVPKERIAAAKQLKGYLQFYEQVLADYLAQLTDAKHLLSVDNTVVQTYFTKYLKDEFVGLEKSDKYEEEYYFKGQHDPLVPTTYFLENAQLRQSFYESKEQYQKRRNLFLDHLLARFGERFTDYTLMLFSLDGDQLATGQALIDDKINFLVDYPALSRSRFKAFNYMPEKTADIWNTDNIAGLKKRLGRLLGIRNLDRRNLHCSTLMKTLVKAISQAGNDLVKFKVSNESNDFFISQPLGNPILAVQLRNKIRLLIGQLSTYEIEESAGRYFIHMIDVATGAKLLTYQRDYPTEGDAEFRLRQILGTLDLYLQSDTIPLGANSGLGPFCGSRENEGFYLFEHILFRPIDDTDEEVLMKICPPKNCETCGDEDPYSFRISIVLPYWTGRFTEMRFRDFFEQTIREEIPAHIHVKICWIGNEQMRIVDETYKSWLQLKQNKNPDTVSYNTATKNLLNILEQLQTVYPQATLHDCEEDGGDRPVHLGRTGLGIF